jgi:hypothetical protein
MRVSAFGWLAISVVYGMIYFASTRHSWRIIGYKREVFVVYGLRATEWG